MAMWTETGTERGHAESAAAGWDGDRYYLFTDGSDRKDSLIWKTVWDSPREAAEFTVAYRSILPARFPALKKAGRSTPDGDFPYQGWEVETGRFVKLARRGSVVGIIDTTHRPTLDLLWN
jgi:hypothetical protein